MLELDVRRILALSDETHFDFRFQLRVILKVGVDVPGEDKARRRLPREHAAPVASAAIVTALVPAPPDPRLDDRVYGVGLADLVDGEGPPRAHLFGEHSPRH